MKQQTPVEWLVDQVKSKDWQDMFIWHKQEIFNHAEKMEKDYTDNKVIHFAEWLTKKHTLTLMALYEQFEEECYNETLNK